MLKNVLRIGLSIGVSLAILALLLQLVTSGLPDGQRPSVLSALQATSLGLVGAYVLLSLVGLFVRATRYRLLISMSGEPNVPNLKQMALVTGIRNMVVDMLPARLGELGYVGLLNRGYGVKLENCVSSLTVAIAFDFIALLVVIMMIIAKQLLGGELQGWVLGAMVSAIVLSLIALIGLFVITPWFSRLMERNFAAKSAESLWGKALTLLKDFSKSLMAVRAAGKTTQVVLLSVLIRVLKYLGMYLLFLGVAAPSFEELAGLPLEHAVGALIGGEIGASLPIPTFMSFGAYEAGSALVFQLLGVADQAAAVVTMLCVHIWSQMMDYLLGGVLLAIFILLVRRGKTAPNSQEAAFKSPSRLAQLASLAAAGFVLMLGSGFLAYQLWAASKLGSMSAPAAGAVAEDQAEWRELSKQHVGGLEGFVVFSSNRDGNHDIFKLDLASFELSKLTEHPHTETYPRVSPNGQRLIFARAHQEWVSQRNTVAWDVYMLDIASGIETKIGSDGTAPAWISDSQITFLQNGTTIVKVDVDSLAVQTLFEPGLENAMPKGAKLQNPSINPVSGDLTFTARQNQIGSPHGHWGTALNSGESHRPVYEGCELRWSIDGKLLYQVAKGGRGDGLRIVSVDPQTLEVSTMIDLDGEFSHEYWPKESAAGDYFVFGASRGKKDHEHDVADYEIFLWKTGSDLSKATRLTFHTGNDNWPDVFIK